MGWDGWKRERKRERGAHWIFLYDLANPPGWFSQGIARELGFRVGVYSGTFPPKPLDPKDRYPTPTHRPCKKWGGETLGIRKLRFGPPLGDLSSFIPAYAMFRIALSTLRGERIPSAAHKAIVPAFDFDLTPQLTGYPHAAWTLFLGHANLLRAA